MEQLNYNDIGKIDSSANTISENSTQVSETNATIHIRENLEGIEKFYNSNHITSIDIIKSQRIVIEKIQRQIDMMQNQIDVTQEIKNKLVEMLMKLPDDKKM